MGTVTSKLKNNDQQSDGSENTLYVEYVAILKGALRHELIKMGCNPSRVKCEAGVCDIKYDNTKTSIESTGFYIIINGVFKQLPQYDFNQASAAASFEDVLCGYVRDVIKDSANGIISELKRAGAFECSGAPSEVLAQTPVVKPTAEVNKNNLSDKTVERGFFRFFSRNSVAKNQGTSCVEVRESRESGSRYDNTVNYERL